MADDGAGRYRRRRHGSAGRDDRRGRRTRVRDRFVVSAPVTGRVLRIELEPGDGVKRGDVVARVRAEAPALLDARTRAEAQAAVESARAALGRARAEEQRARAALAQAERELARGARARRERADDATQELDAARGGRAGGAEAVNAAAVRRAAPPRRSCSAPRRAWRRPSADISGRVISVTAPVDGVVSGACARARRVVPAGDPLLEIGDPRQLEIVSDLLSTDAVRVAAGRTRASSSSGAASSRSRRRSAVSSRPASRRSPRSASRSSASTSCSTLSIRQGAWQALGDAYRVEVRIVVWERRDVLKVPTSALFRQGERGPSSRFVTGRRRRQR